MKRMPALLSDQLWGLKISCRRPVKERQKLPSKLCIEKKKTSNKASMRATETSKQTVHRQQHNIESTWQAWEQLKLTSKLCIYEKKQEWEHVISFWYQTHQLVVWRMRLLTRARHSVPRVCTSVPFILSVSVSTLILALQATRRPISGFRTTWAWKLKGWISWNDCVREICRENKRNMHNSTGLTATWSARSVYLGGSGSHNEWHVSTPACYLLLKLPRVRLSAGY